MIEKVYIDNYRTLVNCVVPLQRVSLLLGENGTGKTSVLDVLRAVQAVALRGETVAEAFPSTTLTRWQIHPLQSFALNLRDVAGLYRYELKIEQDSADRRRGRVIQESLTLDDRQLLSFEKGEVHLSNDRGSGPGARFTYDWTKSALSVVLPRPDNQKLVGFKAALGRVMIVKPCPPMVVRTSEGEQDQLNGHAENFVSWYRYVQRQEIGKQAELFSTLAEVIPGFRSLSIAGEAFAPAVLRVRWRQNGTARDEEYDFDELSDGQRMLILLYSLLRAMPGEGWTLVIDEPDNYLALREIQPWLLAVQDAVGGGVEQAVIASHHPECIDLLAESRGVWFSRPDALGTRVSAEPPAPIEGIKISEVVARGWQHE